MLAGLNSVAADYLIKRSQTYCSTEHLASRRCKSLAFREFGQVPVASHVPASGHCIGTHCSWKWRRAFGYQTTLFQKILLPIKVGLPEHGALTIFSKTLISVHQTTLRHTPLREFTWSRKQTQLPKRCGLEEQTRRKILRISAIKFVLLHTWW